MAQFNKDPQKDFNKIFNGTPPRSMQNGGSGLDAGCGDVGQAEAGTGLDSVTKQLARDTTEFSRETTSHPGSPSNGQSGLPLMSAEGSALANRTAPASAYDTRISQSSVDRAIRGKEK